MDSVFESAMDVLKTSGVQKALTLAALIVIGFLLRDKFDKPKVAGIQALIMQVMLPAVVFKSLISSTFSVELLLLPLLTFAFAIWQLIVGHFVGAAMFPGETGLGSMRRSVMVMFSASAPGLSSFAFINEFVSSEAGPAAFADLGNKVYLLALFPGILKYISSCVKSPSHQSDDPASPKKKKDKKKKGASKEVIPAVPPPPAAATSHALLEPLNMAIICGIAMSLAGKPLSSLGFIGDAIDKLAAAQTPALFVLVGLKLQLSGNTPLVCFSVLLFRYGSAMIFSSLLIRFCHMNVEQGLVVALLSQAAASIIAYGQLDKAVLSSSNGSDHFHAELAFDIVSFSFPISTILNTSACLLGASYVENLMGLGIALIAVAASTFLSKRTVIQDLKVWRKS